MTPAERIAIIRRSILECLYAQSPGSLPVETMLSLLTERQVKVSKEDLDAELLVLYRKELVKQVRSLISVTAVRWEITPQGCLALESEGGA
jgi:hypothetical protein